MNDGDLLVLLVAVVGIVLAVVVVDLLILVEILARVAALSVDADKVAAVVSRELGRDMAHPADHR